MRAKLLVFIFIILNVSGCGSGPSVPTAALNEELHMRYKVAEVRINIADDAAISWSAQQDKFARSKGLSTGQEGTDLTQSMGAASDKWDKYLAVTKSAECQQFLRSSVKEVLKKSVTPHVAAMSGGTRPAILVVDVKRFTLSTIQSMDVIVSMADPVSGAILLQPRNEKIEAPMAAEEVPVNGGPVIKLFGTSAEPGVALGGRLGARIRSWSEPQKS